MFKTRITEILGIEYPIIAGPMAYLSQAKLVSAVSNAGGLGILASTAISTLKELREEIKKTKSMTDKPFAVNVTLFYRPREASFEEYFTAIIEEDVKIIETSGRNPEPYIKLLKDAGVKTMHRATRIMDIQTAERVGIDAVTILGVEAAGRPGMENVTSLVRIPIAVDAVKIPVIAAGGIADARSFVAALALGAEGVLMGTRFLLSKECPTHPKFKEWLLELRETDTILIQRSTANAARIAKTDYSLKLLELEKKGATLEELQPLMGGDRRRKAYATGDVSEATVSIGQSVGLVHDIPTVKEIIDGIISEAKQIMQHLHHKILIET